MAGQSCPGGGMEIAFVYEGRDWGGLKLTEQDPQLQPEQSPLQEQVLQELGVC